MIIIEGICKRVGDFRLRPVSIKVIKGEYLVVLGPTGSGKSFLLETIMGKHYPDGGRILLGGKDVTYAPVEERRIGVVYQECLLFPHLSVSENIKFGLKSKRLPEKEIDRRFDNIVDLLKIGNLKERNPLTLSGGEKQKVALARALVIVPEVLLLDETLSALDPNTRQELTQELKRIHRQMGTTTIHVTHNFEEALALADRIAVMHDGGIAQVGTPPEIFGTPNCEFVAKFTGSDNLFKGQSSIREGVSEIGLYNGTPVPVISICSSTLREGRVWIVVRPSDVLVSRQKISSGAVNCFRGKVSEIEADGPLTKVTVDTGIPIKAAVTRKTCRDLSLGIDEPVFVSFKATEVRVF